VRMIQEWARGFGEGKAEYDDCKSLILQVSGFPKTGVPQKGWLKKWKILLKWKIWG